MSVHKHWQPTTDGSGRFSGGVVAHPCECTETGGNDHYTSGRA